MPADAQGIWQYTEGETASLASTMLNRLASSTSTQVAAIRADTGWVAATLLNSWVAFGTTYRSASYRRLGGVCHVRGMIKNGVTASGTVIFTLPAGFRPGPSGKTDIYPAAGAAGAIGIELDGGTGNVVIGPTAASATWLALAFSFPVDQ